MQPENIVKISNPQRITRILRRICQAGIPVIIRDPQDSVISVKGRAIELELDNERSGLRIGGVSEKGIDFIKKKQIRVQVEFVMMSTKVVFISRVLAFESSGVLLALPTALVSIERRKNTRYACTEDYTSLLYLSIAKFGQDDVSAPPFFLPHLELSSLLNIADLSFGGICIVSRFPALNELLQRGVTDQFARLLIPMIDPIDVKVRVKWVKKIKESISDSNTDNAFIRSFRFGLEFVESSELIKSGVHHFIQLISQEGAI